MNINNYLLFDGAYGTYYQSVDRNKIPSCEWANLYDKEGILNIHLQYLDGGCTALKTNTYGANTYRLNCVFGKVLEIIDSGYEIATRASRGRVPVFADIGPVIDGDGKSDYDQMVKIVDRFIELGAKHFLFETNFDDEIYNTLIPYIRNKTEAFIIVSFAVDTMGYTKCGRFYKDLFENCEKLADACGLNCLSGPAHLLELVKNIETRDKLISVMPNAGYPTTENGRVEYNINPEYFAEKVYEIYKSGVKIVGGCCGTSPEHIKLLAKKLKNLSTDIDFSAKKDYIGGEKIENRFLDKLQKGEKVVACELHAPMEPDYRDVIEKAKTLKNSGVDLITFADSPMARPKADSFITASKIKREAGIDAMPHLSCRDRNYIAIRGALIGGYAEKLRNVLVITGDPIVDDDKKGVFNFNSYGLIQYIDGLNARLFAQQNINIGCGANPNATNFEVELSRCKTKQERGAYFVMTQPTYTDKGLDNVIKIKKETGLKVLAGIMPIASYKNALFLNNEVPGIEIPAELIKRYEGTTREEAEVISEEFSLSVMKKLFEYVDGFYFMCPLNRIEVVSKLAERVKNNDFNW